MDVSSPMYSVLGLDPGLNCTGYSLVTTTSEDYKLAASGTFRTSSTMLLSARLKQICEGLRELIEYHKPDQAAIEEAFMAHNARSALLLGHIRGALLLTISQCGIPAFEYSPREVKMAVVGYGAASKLQVRSMLQTLLHINKDERYSLDATDAMGIALCHIHTHGSRMGTNKVNCT